MLIVFFSLFPSRLVLVTLVGIFDFLQMRGTDWTVYSDGVGELRLGLLLHILELCKLLCFRYVIGWVLAGWDFGYVDFIHMVEIFCV